MSERRTVKLLRLSRSQVVRIPRAFELPGDEAIIRKEGERLIIERKRNRDPLLEYLDSLEPLEEEFPEFKDRPPDPVQL